MLKMVGDTANGRKLVVFGLSHLNLERLKAGQPIHFPGEDVGIEGIEVMIFAGETERTMQRELAELVGSKTNVSIDPRLKD